jgi:hypothetical protein
MTINRRLFFAALVFARGQAATLQVAILETFDIEGGAAAVLVHHADEATRGGFAEWLRSHPRARVRVRTPRGEEVSATMFRVRMCFGRGLILFDKPVRIREREVLSLFS